MSQPAPGWYPDPAGTQRLRWWNGGMWLDQYQPMPGAAPQQGFPAQHQAAAQQGFPTQHNAAPQQGFPAQHNAAPQQGFPAQQAAPAPGPHMPSAQQAPTVSADPYHSAGTTPAFGQSDTAMSGATAPAASTSSSSGKGWRNGRRVGTHRRLRRDRRVHRNALREGGKRSLRCRIRADERATRTRSGQVRP